MIEHKKITEWVKANINLIDKDVAQYKVDDFYSVMVDAWLGKTFGVGWYFNQGSGPLGFRYDHRYPVEIPKQIAERFKLYRADMGGEASLHLKVRFHSFRGYSYKKEDASLSIRSGGINDWEWAAFFLYGLTGRTFHDRALENAFESRMKETPTLSNRWKNISIDLLKGDKNESRVLGLVVHLMSFRMFVGDHKMVIRSHPDVLKRLYKVLETVNESEQSKHAEGPKRQ